MKSSIMMVELGISATNEQLIDQMRIMKRAREDGTYKHIVATIRDFGDDPRELFDIPEVRAFSRRVVNLGFISYLEMSTAVGTDLPTEAKLGWGAYEFWLCAENRLRRVGTPHKGILCLKNFTLHRFLKECSTILHEANSRADALLGPLDVNMPDVDF